jgi:hypothetical protein
MYGGGCVVAQIRVVPLPCPRVRARSRTRARVRVYCFPVMRARVALVISGPARALQVTTLHHWPIHQWPTNGRQAGDWLAVFP